MICFVSLKHNFYRNDEIRHRLLAREICYSSLESLCLLKNTLTLNISTLTSSYGSLWNYFVAFALIRRVNPLKKKIIYSSLCFKFRTVAYGFLSVCGRIGGIAGTQNNTLSKIAIYLPFTLNGCLSLGCMVVCMFLNDTYSAPMEDFIEEDETRWGMLNSQNTGTILSALDENFWMISLQATFLFLKGRYLA